jgi:protein-S-isoprenylcysteine O-methyltransferase Ste14
MYQLIDDNILIEWLNFSIFVMSLILMSYFYTLSIQPVKREAKRGIKAWKECKLYRSLGGLFEFIIVINMVLWIWFPISEVNWKISPNICVGIMICIAILIPCLIVLGFGVKAAGSETLTPSKETKMYGGIYNYIRHPQTVGEFPTFVALAFALNSWFLVILTSLSIIIYIPIMIHYEEQDLIGRFGNNYREYQQKTGAIFPRIHKRNNK